MSFFFWEMLSVQCSYTYKDLRHMPLDVSLGRMEASLHNI